MVAELLETLAHHVDFLAIEIISFFNSDAVLCGMLISILIALVCLLFFTLWFAFCLAFEGEKSMLNRAIILGLGFLLFALLVCAFSEFWIRLRVLL